MANIPWTRAPAPMFSIGWVEDIDLSGGTAAIATILGQQPDFRDGSDDLRPTFDIFIKRIWITDETVGATDARVYADRSFKNTVTILRAQQQASAEWPVVCHEFPGLGFKIPKGTKLSCTGSGSGSGAEQHAVILDCWSPHFKPPLQIGNVNQPGVYIAHGLKTGTLVAATLTGEQDILGHTAAFEDSELSFGVDPNAKYTLYGINPRPGGAGYAVCGFKHPSGLYYWLRPALMAVDAPIWYPMDQPWAFNGAEKAAPRLVGAGVSTTSTEFQPLFIAH